MFIGPQTIRVEDGDSQRCHQGGGGGAGMGSPFWMENKRVDRAQDLESELLLYSLSLLVLYHPE